jgi:hypothetical protein
MVEYAVKMENGSILTNHLMDGMVLQRLRNITIFNAADTRAKSPTCYITMEKWDMVGQHLLQVVLPA